MRPGYLTVLCWILIVLGLLGLLGPIMMWTQQNSPEMKQALALSPVSLEVQIAMSLVGAIVSIVAGVGMLNGWNWSRWLYVVYTIAAIAFGVATIGLSPLIIPSIVIGVIVAGITFLPGANAYLTGKARTVGA